MDKPQEEKCLQLVLKRVSRLLCLNLLRLCIFLSKPLRYMSLWEKSWCNMIITLQFCSPIKHIYNKVRLRMYFPLPHSSYEHIPHDVYSLQWRCNERDGVIVHSSVYSRTRSKKTSKLRVTGLCAGNSPVTGEFSAQRASNILWRHHVPWLWNNKRIT